MNGRVQAIMIYKQQGGAAEHHSGAFTHTHDSGLEKSTRDLLVNIDISDKLFPDKDRTDHGSRDE